MTPLVLSILSSSVILVIFKYFERFKVNNFQAITVNYAVAAGLGFFLSPIRYPAEQLVSKPWALSAIIIGCAFIGMFYLIALSSQKVGVAISSVASKMSLVIPVIAGVVLYSESLAGLKLLGVLLAITAVVLVALPKNRVEIERKYLVLPFIIFLGSGLLDTGFKYVQTHQLEEQEIGIFSSSLFLIAALVGLTVMIIRRLINGSTLEAKSIIAGFALGVPNYFSIHFILNALNLPNLESTVVFPVNNTGVVLLSTLLAIILFSEKISKLNWAGIILAVVSITLIAIS